MYTYKKHYEHKELCQTNEFLKQQNEETDIRLSNFTDLPWILRPTTF